MTVKGEPFMAMTMRHCRLPTTLHVDRESRDFYDYDTETLQTNLYLHDNRKDLAFYDYDIETLQTNLYFI